MRTPLPLHGNVRITEAQGQSRNKEMQDIRKTDARGTIERVSSPDIGLAEHIAPKTLQGALAYPIRQEAVSADARIQHPHCPPLGCQACRQQIGPPAWAVPRL